MKFIKVHTALVHEESKTFQCFLCQGSFDTELKLQKHEKEFHDQSLVDVENLANKTKDTIRNDFLYKKVSSVNEKNMSDELIMSEITDKNCLITPKKEPYSEKFEDINCENVYPGKFQSKHVKRVHGEKIISPIISQGEKKEILDSFSDVEDVEGMIDMSKNPEIFAKETRHLNDRVNEPVHKEKNPNDLIITGNIDKNILITPKKETYSENFTLPIEYKRVNQTVKEKMTKVIKVNLKVKQTTLTPKSQEITNVSLEFFCENCKKIFSSKHSLKTHKSKCQWPKQVHEKKKRAPPLKKKCPECGLYVYNLNNHITGVHGNEKHECQHCQVVFKTKGRYL